MKCPRTVCNLTGTAALGWQCAMYHTTSEAEGMPAAVVGWLSHQVS